MSATETAATPVDAVTLSAAPYGHLRVLAKPNPHTGVLRCLVRSTGATGMFTLEPHFDCDNVDPATTRLKIHYGDELPAGAHTGTYRPNRPLIGDAIRLVDHTLIDARTARHTGGRPGARVYHRDAGSSHRRARVPAPVARHTTAILTALATYWLRRPDLDQLRHAAARALLRQIGLHRKLATIAELEALIADRQRELADQRTQLARMNSLLAEDDLPSRSPSSAQTAA